MDEKLTPIYVRLRQTTVDALREARARSHHRTMAAYVDEVLRRHLTELSWASDRVDRLSTAARSIKEQ